MGSKVEVKATENRVHPLLVALWWATLFFGHSSYFFDYYDGYLTCRQAHIISFMQLIVENTRLRYRIDVERFSMGKSYSFKGG